MNIFPTKLLSLTIVSLATALTAMSADDAAVQKLQTELRDLRQQMKEMQTRHAKEMEEIRELLSEQATVAEVSPDAAADTPPISLYEKFKSTPEPAMETPRLSLYDSFKQASFGQLAPASQGMTLDLSVVLDMYLYHSDRRDGIYELLPQLPRDESLRDTGRDSDSGFNLRSVELSLSAAVDPYFYAWTTVAIEEDGAEFEEAVMQTTGLPYGLTLSGGKLLSGIGRLNHKHSHDWDFVDHPLVYEMMFGDEHLAEKGAQLTWLAPTPFYLLFGTEVLQGENETAFGSVDSDLLRSRSGPRLCTGFVKIGPDLGPRHALELGFSGLAGRHQWEYDDNAAAQGDTKMFGTDLVYKYDAKRSHGHGDFILQGEYMYRDIDLDGRGDWAGEPLTACQDGYYLQALYGFQPRWRGGLRWDQIGLRNDARVPHEGAYSIDDSQRITAMLDCKLTEFSLLRLQAGHGRYDTMEGDKNAWEVALQWQVNFGQHPAHAF